MLLVAVRTGLGVFIILAILGSVQARSITDPLLLFVTTGLIPGTSIEVPPELTLIIVGALLMTILALLISQYLAYKATLEAVLPEYVRDSQDGATSGYQAPQLRRVVLAGRSVLYLAAETGRELYFWLRSFGRPLIAQAISVRKELSTTLVRFDRRIATSDLQESLESFDGKLRDLTREGAKTANLWADKALAYFVRLTLR